MRDRHKQLSELCVIQRAQRDLAAIDYADAQARADVAWTVARQASDHAAALADKWHGDRDRYFSPETFLAIGQQLIAAEAESRSRSAAADKDMQASEDIRRHWRECGARVEANDVVRRELRRAIARHHEEARMDYNIANLIANWGNR